MYNFSFDFFNGWVGSPANYIQRDKIGSVLPRKISANGIFARTAVKNHYEIVVNNSRIAVRNGYKIFGHNVLIEF